MVRENGSLALIIPSREGFRLGYQLICCCTNFLLNICVGGVQGREEIVKDKSNLPPDPEAVHRPYRGVVKEGQRSSCASFPCTVWLGLIWKMEQ